MLKQEMLMCFSVLCCTYFLLDLDLFLCVFALLGAGIILFVEVLLAALLTWALI